MSNDSSFVNQLRNMNQIDEKTEKQFKDACYFFKEECVKAARQ